LVIAVRKALASVAKKFRNGAEAGISRVERLRLIIEILARYKSQQQQQKTLEYQV
jgi:hypothetical protein